MSDLVVITFPNETDGPAALVGAVSHFQGKDYQSSLDPEVQGQLEQALRNPG